MAHAIGRSQCHGNWWHSDARSLAVNSYDVGLILQEYSGFSSSRVNADVKCLKCCLEGVNAG